MRTLLVTGGAGFIGSALVRHLVAETGYAVVNVDALTLADVSARVAPLVEQALEGIEPGEAPGFYLRLRSVAEAARSDRYTFEHVDVCDAAEVARLFRDHRPAGVVHLAAESHVDRSIDGPAAFVQTNVVGTFTLLDAARAYVRESGRPFRFLHVSTDEVYGTLGATGLFTEETPVAPNSPYSATKAASDHLARAYHHTYGLDVVTTNCSNNYGPFHFPEKVIPVVILKALAGEAIPVYGAGQNVRDWLYVDDHVRALVAAFERGRAGETYNVGGHNEKTNLDVVSALCGLLDEMAPAGAPHARLVTFVTDRPGHDARYAIDASKIGRELGWTPAETFETGLRRTVRWFLDNGAWTDRVRSGDYRMERLGTAGM